MTEITAAQARHPFPLTLFYDAACPVCALEMDHLRARDTHGRLAFVDIAAPGFDAAAHGGTRAAMQAELHGVYADGHVIRGMATLREAYRAAGLGWLLWPTALGPLRPAFDAAYRLFARHRQPMSRAAAPLIRALRAHRTRHMAGRIARCDSAACAQAPSRRAKEI